MKFDFSEFDEFKDSFEFDDDVDEETKEREEAQIQHNRQRRTAHREKARKEK